MIGFSSYDLNLVKTILISQLLKQIELNQHLCIKAYKFRFLYFKNYRSFLIAYGSETGTFYEFVTDLEKLKSRLPSHNFFIHLYQKVTSQKGIRACKVYMGSKKIEQSSGDVNFYKRSDTNSLYLYVIAKENRCE